MLSELHDERGSVADAVTGLLAVAVVLGSAAMWIGIPFGGLWLAGELTSTAQGFLFATLGGIPLAMTASAWLLYRVNDLYVRSRGAPGGGRRRSAWLVSSSDERNRVRRAREPRPLIDVAMTVSATTALILMAIWFFFYSQMWLVNPL